MERYSRAAVTVVDEPGDVCLAAPEGHLEGIEGEIGARVARGLPADDEAAVGVEDERYVDETRPGAHVGEVGEPEAVRSLGGEVAVDQIGRPRRLGVTDRRCPLLAAHGALKALAAHQALHRAAGYGKALTVQLPPDL